MSELFTISLRDFLTRKFILLSILPLFCSLMLFGWLVFFGGGELMDALKAGAASGDFAFLDESRFSFIATILSFEFVKWIIGAIFYVLGAFLAMFASVFLAVAIAGFFTPIVAKEINARHYRQSVLPEVATSRVVSLSMRVVGKFLLIFLVCLPLIIFVPFINLLVLNVPFFYLYYKLMLIDVGSSTLNDSKFELAWLEGGGLKFKIACVAFYLASLLPLVGLFFQLFFIIFLSHISFQRQIGRVNSSLVG